MSKDERYRILALDFGVKRIGIAISDEMRMLASPRGVIENNSDAIEEIIRLATNSNVREILLGLPKTLKGADSEMTAKVRLFHDRLAIKLGSLGISLEFRDERFTSVIANANIAERGLSKKKRENKSLRDEEAARIVLQEYLDSLH